MLDNLTIGGKLTFWSIIIGVIGIIVTVISIVPKLGKKRELVNSELVEKLIEAMKDKFQAEKDRELTKDSLRDAINRISESAGSAAEKMLEGLRQTGDMSGLQDMLLKDKEKHIKDAHENILKRNYEILTVAYLRGDIDIAESVAKEILQLKPNDLTAICRMGHIYNLRGRLDLAEKAYKHMLNIITEDDDISWQAAALGNLGIIYGMQADFNQVDFNKAEKYICEALKIDKRIGFKEGEADNYGNLGNIYAMKNKFVDAEKWHRKALEINEQLGNKKSLAEDYSNLAEFCFRKGDAESVKEAKDFCNKALKINEELGNKEGMANNFGNLGYIYQNERNLDKAEKMHLKALEIDEQMGKKVGMANTLDNLGMIWRLRGQKVMAKQYWEKSLHIYKEVGMPSNARIVQSWMDKL